jgi:hypothetical protein
MLNHNKHKIRLIPNADLPANLNVSQATRKQVSHAGAQSTTGRGETAKKMPAPDISIIEQQRAWEHTQLERELKYQRRKHGASMYLLEEVRLVVEVLQQALVNFQKLNAEFEDEVTET